MPYPKLKSNYPKFLPEECGNRPKFNDSQRKDICKMYKEGDTLTVIAEYYGCSRMTILKIVDYKKWEHQTAVSRMWKAINFERIKDRHYASKKKTYEKKKLLYPGALTVYRKEYRKIKKK